MFCLVAADDYFIMLIRLSHGYLIYREEVNEVVKGLREYFNVTLGSQLLYKFERLQYSEASCISLEFSQIYIHYLM